jgi:hypothetical protein
MMFASSRRVDAEEARNELIAQPRSDLESPVAEAETVAKQIRSNKEPLGPPGRPFTLDKTPAGLADHLYGDGRPSGISTRIAGGVGRVTDGVTMMV